MRKQPRARNKDGTWRKKRSDTGVKRERHMINTPRDTQFQPEAEVLIRQLGSEGFVFEGSDDPEREKHLEHARLLIAQWAFDFACHIWDETIGGGNPGFVIGGMRGMNGGNPNE